METAMITPPSNKYHLQVSIQHPPLLDKPQTDKLCFKGAVQSGLRASAIAGQSFIRAAPLPFLVWSIFIALKRPS